MQIKNHKKERIKAAQKFAAQLEHLFEEYYENHKPPFFIFIKKGHNDSRTIKVFNGYSVGLIGEGDERLADLIHED